MMGDELVARVILREAHDLGGLSEAAMVELTETVRTDLQRHLSSSQDVAFQMLCELQHNLALEMKRDPFLSEEQYTQAWDERIERIRSDCQLILDLDDTTIDAKLLLALTAPAADEVRISQIEALAKLDESFLMQAKYPETTLTWDNPFARPLFRAKETLARALFHNGCYKQARLSCEKLLALDSYDHMHARYTLALTLARLEDEEALEDLRIRFKNLPNPWFYLAHILILYKFDRMAAARRALFGMCNTYPSTGYLILHPYYVEPYLAGRPPAGPGSLSQVAQAVHEAAHILVDCPDFVRWVATQGSVMEDAMAYAKSHGLEW